MYDKDFRVKLISSKNSFIFLSEKDGRQVDHDHIIRLSYGLNKRAYFSLGTSLNSLKEGELAMCSILAKELGIIKNDTVSLSTTPHIPNIRKLNLHTASEDDYEMLGVLAETVQSTLLNQVKIVHNEQKLVIWITNSLHVTVVVDGVLPMSPGKLEMLTEVAILPPPQNEPNIGAHQSKRGSLSKQQQQKDSIMSAYNQTQCALRLLPIASVLPPPSITAAVADRGAPHHQPFSALLSRRHFDRLATSYHHHGTPMTLVTLRIVSPPSDIRDVLDEQQPPVDAVAARLFCIDADGVGQIGGGGTPPPPPDALFAHATIMEYFRARPGAKVLVAPLKQSAFAPRSIDIVTTSAFFNRADELVRNYMCQYCQDGHRMLVNSGVVMMEDAAQCRYMLKFNPANERHLIVDQRLMRECKFRISEVELFEKPFENPLDKEKPLELCLNCSNYQQIIDDITNCLVKYDSSVILTGKTGSGKTCLTKKIASNLRETAYRHVEYVDCRKLKGKSIESLLKTFNSIFLKLVYYQPAVLVLDDLHVICEKVVEGEQATQENLHFNKVSEMLSEELIHLLANNRIWLLGTTESMAKLNQNIYTSRGTHLFKNTFSINELTKENRITILRYLLTKKETNYTKVDFNQLGIKTEGYLIQDLSDLVDKIIFEAYKKSTNLSLTNQELVITNEHCETAVGKASTLSLRDVPLHAPGDRDFSDIGGLDDVKKVLVETMLWPAQYAHIFSHVPLRLQSGVLLYGPPGTGKTILAGAAARQCNLRLISVKGPELLSKYIGASEQAVRDVFQKAQSAKPCILFFDEFDSLAPRRGHDNTGVTDRVVNQFLTQLDGVESLSGVCVLAATSRPDLLDPALLRPGRLDRQLLCPMPNADGRRAILKSLSQKLNLGSDAQLERIATQTEGFSGADLQAVLYTAQLNAVAHLLADESADNMKGGGAQLVTDAHLQQAVKTTRPSLTREERAKYERIYQKFEGKTDILESLKSGKQKATLA